MKKTKQKECRKNTKFKKEGLFTKKDKIFNENGESWFTKHDKEGLM